MPHAVPNYGTYALSTDDGQEIDLYRSFFSPQNMQYYTFFLGSEAAAREAIQGAWDQFCQNPRTIIGVCVFFFMVWTCTWVPQLKPTPGSTSSDVQTHQLFRDYSVRIWGGGIESLNSFHFDFVDPLTSHPINLPPNWKIFVVSGPFTKFSMYGTAPMPLKIEIKSLEAHHGVRSRELRPGEEKYMEGEGARLLVVSPRGEEAVFQLPIRRSIHLDAGQVIVYPGMP
jgi:hypothetical protein